VVPGEALTRGLATIMRATRIELIAAGAHKAAAVTQALHGPITEQCPASILQRHPDVHVSLDHDAAARLREQKKGGFGRT
jgi:glucosamine-6-phosphate deaminase